MNDTHYERFEATETGAIPPDSDDQDLCKLRVVFPLNSVLCQDYFNEWMTGKCYLEMTLTTKTDENEMVKAIRRAV